MDCRQCDDGIMHTHCPAGGPHEWGLLEEWGTGRTWPGCEHCGESYPPDPDELRVVRRSPDPITTFDPF